MCAMVTLLRADANQLLARPVVVGALSRNLIRRTKTRRIPPTEFRSTTCARVLLAGYHASLHATGMIRYLVKMEFYAVSRNQTEVRSLEPVVEL